MEIEHWTDIPDKMDPDNPDNYSLEYSLGTTVSFNIGRENYGGVIVGVNEHGRPIVFYIGPSADGRKLTPSFRTCGWDALTEM